MVEALTFQFQSLGENQREHQSPRGKENKQTNTSFLEDLTDTKKPYGKALLLRS